MSIAFWIIAALMALLAILIVGIPIMRGAGGARDDAAEANIAIYRRRVRELEDERATGAISQRNFASARAEIDRQLLDDVGEETAASVASNSGRRRLSAALMASLLVPGVVIGFYAWNGLPSLPNQGPPAILQGDAQAQLAFVEKQLSRLETRLQQQPDDGKGWLMLGRAYALFGRYADAAGALKKAQGVLGVSAPLLAERAQALARAADGRFEGEPARLLADALKLDPGNTQALWLSGIAAEQAGKQALAAERWRAALATVSADSAAAATIRNALEQPADPTGGDAASSSAVGRARIEVSVQLDPKFAREFAADTPVFVFARAVDGPRMPLAVVRTTVGRLPQTLTLDDSKALSGGAKLSAFREVRIVARVSPDGQAMPKAGNVQGSSGPIQTHAAQPVTLVMNARI